MAGPVIQFLSANDLPKNKNPTRKNCGQTEEKLIHSEVPCMKDSLVFGTKIKKIYKYIDI